MQSVDDFLERSGFHRKLERWIYEKNIAVALRDSGFDVVRMKRVWDLSLTVVTAKSDIHREARFVEGPVTRIHRELRHYGLRAENDHVDLSHQGHALTVVVGVNESRRQRRRWRSGKVP